MQSLTCRSTIARIVILASQLAGPRGATKKELIEKLEVSTKTIARDFEFLKDRLGLDIQCEIHPFPQSRAAIEYRHRAVNAAEVLPMIETLGRMAL
jgi:HTH domain